MQVNEAMDRRFPTRESCVLEPLLRRQAEDRSDQVFVTFEDGVVWTYAETYLQACQAAAGLQTLGVDRGDSVLSWLPNGPNALRAWFGANFVGAIFTPLNLAYRGRLLEHVIANSGASIIVLHAELADRLSEIELGNLTRAVVIGDSQVSIQRLQTVSSDILVSAGEFRSLAEPVEPWDDYGILYTSGTTGPSKGVLSTYIQLYEGVRAAFLGCGVSADDDSYVAIATIPSRRNHRHIRDGRSRWFTNDGLRLRHLVLLASNNATAGNRLHAAWLDGHISREADANASR